MGADLFDEGDPQPTVPSSTSRPPDHRHGHRQRLRERFLAGGPDALPDYELLELVLFRAIPRRDVKPLAKALIERFGDFAGVSAARIERLREVDGLGDAAIVELKVIEAAAQRFARASARDKPLLSDWDALEGYVRATMARAPVESFRALFLDRKNRLIADEELGRGTLDQVAVYPREVLRRALDLDAGALVLAHNHPSGDPTPSRADVALTKKLVAALSAADVAVHDHLVVGRERIASLRDLGLM